MMHIGIIVVFSFLHHARINRKLGTNFNTHPILIGSVRRYQSPSFGRRESAVPIETMDDNLEDGTYAPCNKLELTNLGKALHKEALESSEPSSETCLDILKSLLEASRRPIMSVAILEATGIGKTLTKSIKCFKRHKRTLSSSLSSDGLNPWDEVIQTGERLLQSWKASADVEAIRKFQTKKKATSNSGLLPKSVVEYKSRLIRDSKEMYKDPPILPPPSITSDKKSYPLPEVNKRTGELSFLGPSILSDSLLDFHPNQSPEQVLRCGSFGGTYFRKITSGVTNITYKPSSVLQSTLDPSWISDLPQTLLTSSTYRKDINKYGVKCGGSLGMWESSGWISDVDPYGWFQWYCRFYSGRRCDDDERQISRWKKVAGLKGRFRSQLCNKIIKANTHAEDRAVSPVIRQTLLHWGFEVTEDVLKKHKERIGA